MSSTRFSRITGRLTYSRRLNIDWCASQIPPIVRKLVA